MQEALQRLALPWLAGAEWAFSSCPNHAKRSSSFSCRLTPPLKGGIRGGEALVAEGGSHCYLASIDPHGQPDVIDSFPPLELLACHHVPVQPAEAPGSAAGLAAGPRRPGLIPLSSQSLISRSGSAISSGPRRPFPARANGVIVANYCCGLKGN